MSQTETWSSKLVFLLAAVGAAVGLANIWKFPYTAGQHGGGGFMLVYLIAIIFISFPIVVTELLLGRRGKAGPVTSIVNVAKEAGASHLWGLAAYAGTFSAVLVMGFYFVITGWIIFYGLQMLTGEMQGLSPDQIAQFFDETTHNETRTVIYQSIAAFITWVVVAAGLKNGIERFVRYLMPLLLVLLIIIGIYSAIYGDLMAALKFLFQVKFEEISAKTVLYASGQAFFTVGAGSCVMIVYGAFLPSSVSIMKSSLQVVAADTAVALMAGIVIFPLVFAFNLQAAEGPGLLFVTLPIVFSQSTTGTIVGAAFFLMVAIAAITSAIAIVQPPVIWLERHFRMRRPTAAMLAIFIIWLLGLGTVCSFDSCSDYYPLDFIPLFAEMTIFGVSEMIAINICLPLGAFFLSIFVGWRMPLSIIEDELDEQNIYLLKFWYFCMRYIIPPAILMIIIFGLK
jgi:neurotransmitter:Na+ symporter, NSS family